MFFRETVTKKNVESRTPKKPNKRTEQHHGVVIYTIFQQQWSSRSRTVVLLYLPVTVDQNSSITSDIATGPLPTSSNCPLFTVSTPFYPPLCTPNVVRGMLVVWFCVFPPRFVPYLFAMVAIIPTATIEPMIIPVN